METKGYEGMSDIVERTKIYMRQLYSDIVKMDKSFDKMEKHFKNWRVNAIVSKQFRHQAEITADADLRKKLIDRADKMENDNNSVKIDLWASQFSRNTALKSFCAHLSEAYNFVNTSFFLSDDFKSQTINQMYSLSKHVVNQNEKETYIQKELRASLNKLFAIKDTMQK